MDLSFVFPCLNEEETLAGCIKELQAALGSHKSLSYEIIVADNGSTDSSRDIARQYGARVVDVPKKGYGAALQGGFSEAKGKYIAFADADGSYPVGEYIFEMLKSAEESNADMVIASRLKGKIEEGAMPFLHRYVGTPVLTGVINLLFSGRITDCNSGFRLLRSEAYKTWDVSSDGMEFASELLVKAMKNKANIISISGGLNKDKRSRPPHLKTWKDGMRHLLLILSEKPSLFEVSGFYLILTATLCQIIAMLTGPVDFFGFNIFYINTNLILLISAVIGVQVYMFSTFLYISSSEKTRFRFTDFLISISEEYLFLWLFLVFIFELSGLGFFISFWCYSGFSNLSVKATMLLILYFQIIIPPGIISFGILCLHILKRRYKGGG